MLTRRPSEGGVRVLAPRSTARARTVAVDPGVRKKGDTDEIAAWRARMGTDRAKALYTQRAASVKGNNVWTRNQQLTRFEVVRATGARAVGLIHTLARHAARLANPGISPLPFIGAAVAKS